LPAGRLVFPSGGIRTTASEQHREPVALLGGQARTLVHHAPHVLFDPRGLELAARVDEIRIGLESSATLVPSDPGPRDRP